jgi:hypothetical protein
VRGQVEQLRSLAAAVPAHAGPIAVQYIRQREAALDLARRIQTRCDKPVTLRKLGPFWESIWARLFWGPCGLNRKKRPAAPLMASIAGIRRLLPEKPGRKFGQLRLLDPFSSGLLFITMSMTQAATSLCMLFCFPAFAETTKLRRLVPAQ